MKGITKEKKIVITVLIVTVLMLTIAFASLSSVLKINGTAKVDSALWDIHFKSASMISKKGDAREAQAPVIENGGIDLTLKVGLRKPKDEITYEAVIVNAGDMDAQIERIDYPELSEDQSKILEFDATYDTGMTLLENQSLKAKEEIKVVITIRFKDITDESLLKTEAYDIPLTFKINYIQSGLAEPAIDRNAESILAGGNNGNETSTFFYGPITKESVEKIKFMPTTSAPSDAIGTWDASEKRDNSVIAWYTDSNSNDLYELYIGGYGKVYAPVDSKYLFKKFNKLVEIDFGDVFDTSKVTNMYSMFAENYVITSLDLSSFDTSNVTTMQQMFNGNNLVSLDISSFNTTNVTNMQHMFDHSMKLTSLDLKHFNVENVTSFGGMFMWCSSLTNLNINNWNTKSATGMESMFLNCSTLTSLDVSSFDTSSVITMDKMFSGCYALTSLDLSNFNTSSVTNMSFMFNGNNLTSLDISSFNTTNVTNMQHMFDHSMKLTSLDLKHFNVENVTSFGGMFMWCSSFTNLDISNWNTKSATNMSSMFYRCLLLASLDVSSFDTSSVISMDKMFSECGTLSNIDLTNINTKNVTNMAGMFYGTNFTSIDVSSFDTSKVTNMASMFGMCPYLESIDLSNFNTSNVTNMTGLFYNDNKLENINFSNADFSNVTSYQNMFYKTTKLNKVNLSNITSDKYSNSNFQNILMLVPSSATVYVKDSDCITAGQSINSNLNYVVYQDV